MRHSGHEFEKTCLRQAMSFFALLQSCQFIPVIYITGVGELGRAPTDRGACFVWKGMILKSLVPVCTMELSKSELKREKKEREEILKIHASVISIKP